MVSEKLRKILEKQQYRLVGDHSAVKICRWTKESLRGRNFCYKQKFYGIQSHRCLQMTPCIACNFQCLFCWRAHPQDLGLQKEEIPEKWDEPDEIIDGCIEGQRKLLSGFKGNEAVDLKKWKEAQNPNQAAISLTGEPTMYPKISELINAFKEREFTTFLVTNGSLPEVLKNIPNPTNLYISLDAPNKKIFLKTDKPMIPNAWEKLNESLSLLQSFSRTVVRITLVKDLNMLNHEEYAKLLQKYRPTFIEFKAFMSVGFSRKRLRYDQMPRHEEVLEFSKKIEEVSDYRIKDQKEDSRVVLLSL
jgi:tRNA wybutosine-synthesizing protein 1